jgi:hypothetical protein
MAKKLTRSEVMALWSKNLADGKIIQIEKEVNVRVVAIRADKAGRIATKENRAPGQSINEGDWRIIAFGDNDDPVPALEKGEQIYVYKDSEGNLVEFNAKHAAALHREPLFDTWMNTNTSFLRNYSVSDAELFTGVAIARANPIVNYAFKLTEEFEIETNWGAPAIGSYWLVAYKVDPDTLEIIDYDCNIVDEDGSKRYKVVGTAVPTTEKK